MVFILLKNKPLVVLVKVKLPLSIFAIPDGLSSYPVSKEHEYTPSFFNASISASSFPKDCFEGMNTNK